MKALALCCLAFAIVSRHWLTIFCLIVAAVWLAGCAPLPIRVAIQAAPAPAVTVADPYERERHAHDDGECRSYGLQAGQAAYVSCREHLEGFRLQKH